MVAYKYPTITSHYKFWAHPFNIVECILSPAGVRKTSTFVEHIFLTLENFLIYMHKNWFLMQYFCCNEESFEIILIWVMFAQPWVNLKATLYLFKEKQVCFIENAIKTTKRNICLHSWFCRQVFLLEELGKCCLLFPNLFALKSVLLLVNRWQLAWPWK